MPHISDIDAEMPEEVHDIVTRIENAIPRGTDPFDILFALSIVFGSTIFALRLVMKEIEEAETFMATIATNQLRAEAAREKQDRERRSRNGYSEAD